MKLSGYVLTCVALTLLLLTCASAGAQDVNRPPGLEKYEAEATDSVEVTIDDKVLRLAAGALSDRKPDERAVKALVAGLKGVYVRSYEFKSEGQFAAADVTAVREQLRAPGWSRVMDVKSRGLDFGDAEVYLATAGGHVEGFALLVVEPKELTVVNIVGSLDLDKLRRLGDTLNLPHIHVKRKKSGGN